MTEPTVAEERFARMIAMWHGQTPIARLPDGSLMTVANRDGSGTGFSWEVDRYVARSWMEYLAAARAIIAMRIDE